MNPDRLPAMPAMPKLFAFDVTVVVSAFSADEALDKLLHFNHTTPQMRVWKATVYGGEEVAS